MPSKRETCKWANDHRNPVNFDDDDGPLIGTSACVFPVPRWILTAFDGRRKNRVDDDDCANCPCHQEKEADNA